MNTLQAKSINHHTLSEDTDDRRSDVPRNRKSGLTIFPKLLALTDSAPEEIERFGEELDDLETIIGRIVRACDRLAICA